MIGLRIHFIGKDTLFRWPLDPARPVGRHSIDRRNPQGFVDEIEREFKRRQEFMVALAPEGTRRAAPFWKSGFYRIAREAKVPVALAFIDFPAREIGVGAYVELTGDIAADMARIRAFYAGKRGWHPENQGPIRLHEER